MNVAAVTLVRLNEMTRHSKYNTSNKHLKTLHVLTLWSTLFYGPSSRVTLPSAILVTRQFTIHNSCCNVTSLQGCKVTRQCYTVKIGYDGKSCSENHLIQLQCFSSETLRLNSLNCGDHGKQGSFKNAP